MVTEKLISCTLFSIARRLIRAHANCHAPILPLPNLRPTAIKIYVAPSNPSTSAAPETKRIALIFKSRLYIHISKNIAPPEATNWMLLERKFADMSFLNTRSGGTEKSCNSGYKEKSNAHVAPVATAIRSGRQCHTSRDTSTLSATSETTTC